MMDWNFLLKRSNNEEKENTYNEYKKELESIKKDGEKINKRIADLKSKEKVLYRIKDRFKIIYPICISIFILLILPALYFISKFKSNVVFVIVFFAYILLTSPLIIISALSPLIKFFAFDLPKLTNEVKIYTSNKYLLALFFMENRYLFPKLMKVNDDSTFDFRKEPYIVDKSANFISVGRISISFYIKGLPNPLIFDFKKYIEHFIKEKNKNPKCDVLQFDNKYLDVGFSSENLREYKKNKLFSEFLRDIYGEANKVLIAILSFAGLVSIIFLLMFILKK